MSITAITIENFKSIKGPVRVELKPITLLFGPNSAGKSTILKALHYAHEIFERQNLNPDKTLIGGEYIDLGGFKNLVYKHKKSLAIKLSIELDLQSKYLPEYMDIMGNFGTDQLDNSSTSFLLQSLQILRTKKVVVEVSICWNKQKKKPYINIYSVYTHGEKLASIECCPNEYSSNDYQINLSKINPDNSIFKSANKEKFKQNLEDIVASRDIGKIIDEMYEISPLRAFIAVFMNHTNGYPGIDSPISLKGQSSALPVWGKNLILDEKIWSEKLKEEIEQGDVWEQEHREIGAAKSETQIMDWVHGYRYGVLNFTRFLSSLIVGPGELVRDELRELCYIGPIRKVPARGHKPQRFFEKSRWANGLAAYDHLIFSEHSFIEKVNAWLTGKEQLNTSYSIKVMEFRNVNNNLIEEVNENKKDSDKIKYFLEKLKKIPIKPRILIKDQSADIELSPHDIGIGISQIIPVVVAALHPQTGITAIEQPELHIHPAMQVALGDLFIESALGKNKEKCFLIETHSEHLLLRLLRRIRETSEQKAPGNCKIKKEELSICFIEQSDNGTTYMPIHVDDEGEFIDRWPKGFFDERFKELY